MKLLDHYNKDPERLDSYDACTISTLWAQGHKPNSGINLIYNCDSYARTTSLVSIAIIPELRHLTEGGDTGSIVALILKGYCENSIKENILKYFLDTC